MKDYTPPGGRAMVYFVTKGSLPLSYKGKNCKEKSVIRANLYKYM